MTNLSQWQRALSDMPLIAILRGITAREVMAIATALKECGFLCVEVPLGSPESLSSIHLLRQGFGTELFIGAGTVLTEDDVAAVHAAGAGFVVSPNVSRAVIRATKALGLVSLPGFATPTEAFAALESGADALKLFPAEMTPPPVLRALKAVLPSHIPVLPVGGISPSSMAAYVSAGAAGFGIGSALFKPGYEAPVVRERAGQLVKAWLALRRPSCAS